MVTEQPVRSFNVYAAPQAPVDVPSEPVALEGGWWRARWLRYNKYVFVSAFIADAVGGVAVLAVLEAWQWIDAILGGLYVSVVAGTVYMALANVCYLLGPFGERLLPAGWRLRYRRLAFGFGLGLAVLIPAGCALLFCAFEFFGRDAGAIP